MATFGIMTGMDLRFGPSINRSRWRHSICGCYGEFVTVAMKSNLSISMSWLAMDDIKSCNKVFSDNAELLFQLRSPYHF